MADGQIYIDPVTHKLTQQQGDKIVEIKDPKEALDYIAKLEPKPL